MNSILKEKLKTDSAIFQLSWFWYSFMMSYFSVIFTNSFIMIYEFINDYDWVFYV